MTGGTHIPSLRGYQPAGAGFENRRCLESRKAGGLWTLGRPRSDSKKMKPVVVLQSLGTQICFDFSMVKPWCWASSLQNCKTINLCFVSSSIYGNLLQYNRKPVHTKITHLCEFPGSSGLRTQHTHCCSPDSVPGQGSKGQQDTWRDRNKTKHPTNTHLTTIQNLYTTICHFICDTVRCYNRGKLGQGFKNAVILQTACESTISQNRKFN